MGAKIIFLFSVCAFLLSPVNSVQTCMFSEKTGDLWTAVTESLYTCEFQNDLLDVNEEIKDVEGTHDDAKTNAEVQVFSIAGKEISFFPKGLAAAFTGLIGVKIDTTNLEYLGKTDLELLTNLKYIGITKSKLSFLPRNVFAANINLEVIDLSNNPIKFIEGDIFATTAAIKSVDFTGISCALTQSTANDLTFSTLKDEIADGKCLDTATSVLETYISRLRTELGTNYQLEETSKEQADQIGELSAENTALNSTVESLEEDLENCLSNSESAVSDLQNCTESVLECEQNLEELVDLTKPVNGTCRFMNYNGIYSCVANDVSIETAADQVKVWSGEHKEGQTNANILSLVIKDLNVKLLPRNVATTFTALNTLIIENTGLTSITKADLTGYQNLVTMVITSNNLTTIEANSLDTLINLKHLDLSKNRITALPLKFFEKLMALTYLDVSTNDITQLRYDLIPVGNVIEEFYANELYLRSIDYSLIYRLKNTKIIEFSGPACNQTKIESVTFITFFNTLLDSC